MKLPLLLLQKKNVAAEKEAAATAAAAAAADEAAFRSSLLTAISEIDSLKHRCCRLYNDSAKI